MREPVSKPTTRRPLRASGTAQVAVNDNPVVAFAKRVASPWTSPMGMASGDASAAARNAGSIALPAVNKMLGGRTRAAVITARELDGMTSAQLDAVNQKVAMGLLVIGGAAGAARAGARAAAGATRNMKALGIAADAGAVGRVPRGGTTIGDAVGPKVVAAAKAKAAGKPAPKEPAKPARSTGSSRTTPAAPKKAPTPPRPDDAYSSPASANRAWATYTKRLGEYNRGRTEKAPMVSRDSVNNVPKAPTETAGKAATDTRVQVARANKNLTAEERRTVATAKPPKRPKRAPKVPIGSKPGTNSGQRMPVLGATKNPKPTQRKSGVVVTPSGSVRAKPTGKLAADLEKQARERLAMKRTTNPKKPVDPAKIPQADVDVVVQDMFEAMMVGVGRSRGGRRPGATIPRERVPMTPASPAAPKPPTPRQVARSEAADARFTASGKKSHMTDTEVKNDGSDARHVVDGRELPRTVKPGRLSGKKGKISEAEKRAQRKAEREEGLVDQSASDTADLMSAGKSNRLARDGEYKVAPHDSQNPRLSDVVPMSGTRAARLRPRGGTRVRDRAGARPRRGTTDRPARTYVHRNGKPATRSAAQKKAENLDAMERLLQRNQANQDLLSRGVPGKPHSDASSLPFEKNYPGTPAKGKKKPNRTGGMDERTPQDVAALDRDNPANAPFLEGAGRPHGRMSTNTTLAPTSRANRDAAARAAARRAAAAAARRAAGKPAAAATPKATPKPKAAPKGAAAEGATPAKPGAKFANGGIEAKYISVPKDKVFGPSAPKKPSAKKGKAAPAAEPTPPKPAKTPKAPKAAAAEGATKPPKAPKPSKPAEPTTADREAGRAAGQGKPAGASTPKKPKATPKADPKARYDSRGNRMPEKDARRVDNERTAKAWGTPGVSAQVRRMARATDPLPRSKKGKALLGLAAIGVAGGVYNRAGDNRTSVKSVTQKATAAVNAAAKPKDAASTEPSKSVGRLDKYGRKISDAEYQRRLAWKAKTAGKSTAEVERMRKVELARRDRYRSKLGTKAYGKAATTVTRNADVPVGIPVKTWRGMSPAVRKRYRRINK